MFPVVETEKSDWASASVHILLRPTRKLAGFVTWARQQEGRVGRSVPCVCKTIKAPLLTARSRRVETCVELAPFPEKINYKIYIICRVEHKKWPALSSVD